MNAGSVYLKHTFCWEWTVLELMLVNMTLYFVANGLCTPVSSETTGSVIDVQVGMCVS